MNFKEWDLMLSAIPKCLYGFRWRSRAVRDKHSCLGDRARGNGTITILYDGDGNRVSKTVSGATTTTTVSYLIDDLIRADGPNGGVAYNLDLVGNRLSANSTVSGVGSTTLSYDADDRLSTWSALQWR
jgi:YD repeat-containing protein